MKPESGFVRCQGTVLFNRESRTDILAEERRIGYVFQNAAVFPHLTVYDNIAYGCRAKGLDRAATDRIVRGLLERLAISHLSGVMAAHLSGGQRQMVVLGRALAIDPVLLLLDEPFRALDGDANLLVNKSIETEVKRAGIPCILVTHNLDEVRMGIGRTCRLEKGRIVEQ
jgi:ABC-type sulfate/molybdate transport systems ATPase subunit